MGCVRGGHEGLDVQLAAISREEAGLRLRLGQVLEVMQRGAHCFALGFSSLLAYALERCERGGRWVELASCLARRLEALPGLRRALATAELSWSKVELLARVAQPADEAHWLELARRRTVRELREQVSRARSIRTRSIGTGGIGSCVSPSAGELEMDSALGAEREVTCTLSCTLDREEAWLLEATRLLLERLGTQGGEEQVEALLAEGQSALLAALPAGALELDLEATGAAQRRWCEQLERWRAEAEARSELRLQAEARAPSPLPGSTVALQAAAGCSSLQGCSSAELDGAVRSLAARLAARELELARLLLEFHRADGWRRLGYATEAQYARERLGMSRSSVLARRALALRLESLPSIGAALGRAEIGVEPALQLVRIATPRTELAWLERARRRTVKHLRQEVAAALVAVRISGEPDCPPPKDAELDGFHELERAVLSGQLWSAPARLSEPGGLRATAGAERARRPWHELLSSLGAWLARGALRHPVQMSAPSGGGPRQRATRSAGRVEVRWRVSLTTRTWWRALEAQARRWLPRDISWLKYLCLVFWRSWGHVLGVTAAYGQVYLRDRCRCMSPVCSRRDVTPHHLRFRSAGGGDEDENIASLCTWCHLFGVHGGRIRATGTASHIHWELGSHAQPCLRVEGRERCQGA